MKLRRRSRSTRGRFALIVLLVWTAVACVFVVFPLFKVIRESFLSPDGWGFANYIDYFADSALRQAVLNSFILAVSVTGCSILIAVPYAWLITRTDLPLRGFFRGSVMLTFAAPSFIAALGWMLLLGPRSGYLNTPLQDLFGLEQGPFNIFSSYGVIFVCTMFLYPLIFLPVAASMENIDSSLEEAGASVGASRMTILRQITLPLLGPAIAAGGMIVFVGTFIIYGPVALLGSPAGFETITTAMRGLLSYQPRIGLAAVAGVPPLVLLSGLLVLQRRYFGVRSFAVIGGKASPQVTRPLRKWRWPAFFLACSIMMVSLVLPFGVLLITSVRTSIGRPLAISNLTFPKHYQAIFDQPALQDAFQNSVLLALGAVVLAIVISLVAAWLVERADVGKRIIPSIMSAPLAFQGAIMAVGLILAFSSEPFAFAGTFSILVAAYIVRSLPLAFSYIQAGYKQLGRELEEAARSVGASPITLMRKVTVPLLAQSILPVAVLLFILNFRELETSVFLATARTPVVAVTLFELSQSAAIQSTGAFSMMVLAINIAIVFLLWLASKFVNRHGKI